MVWGVVRFELLILSPLRSKLCHVVVMLFNMSLPRPCVFWFFALGFRAQYVIMPRVFSMFSCPRHSWIVFLPQCRSIIAVVLSIVVGGLHYFCCSELLSLSRSPLCGRLLQRRVSIRISQGLWLCEAWFVDTFKFRSWPVPHYLFFQHGVAGGVCFVILVHFALHVASSHSMFRMMNPRAAFWSMYWSLWTMHAVLILILANVF